MIQLTKPDYKARYREFLKTPFWVGLSREKTRRQPRCQRCGVGQRLQCHHKFYRQRWEDTQLGDLEVLCDGCHGKEHGVLTLKIPFSPSKRKKRLRKWREKQERKRFTVRGRYHV